MTCMRPAGNPGRWRDPAVPRHVLEKHSARLKLAECNLGRLGNPLGAFIRSSTSDGARIIATLWHGARRYEERKQLMKKGG